MKAFALTGGIASGKSTVGEIFQDLGATLIDADQVAHQIYAPGTPLAREIQERFGLQVLHPSGEINRESLGKLIFANPKERKWLEAKTHPATRQKIAHKIRSSGENQVILVEAALHIETEYYKDFLGLIVVHVNPETQIERLKGRDGFSEADAQEILQNQMPVEDKLPYADWIIDNNGNLILTKAEVEQVYQELRNKVL